MKRSQLPEMPPIKHTHVAAGLMYLPTPWRYVWGPWFPGGGWLLTLASGSTCCCVFFRS